MERSISTGSGTVAEVPSAGFSGVPRPAAPRPSRNGCPLILTPGMGSPAPHMAEALAGPTIDPHSGEFHALYQELQVLVTGAEEAARRQQGPWAA